MQNFKRSIPCCALIVVLAASSAHGAVTLVKDGQPKAAIFVPATVMSADDKNIQQLKNPEQTVEAQRQGLRAAVKDLALYLEKMSGGKFDIVAGEPKPDDKRVRIFVGELAAKAFGPVGKNYPYQQGFRVVVGGAGVGLMGESDLATSYAIYELLDRLGCRWFMPSEQGEVVPHLATIALEDMDLKLAPGTIFRSISYADEAYRRRNRMGGLLLYCGQVLETAYLSKEELAKHPEWIGATADGKPMHNRFKWSNKELASAIADRIIDSLKTSPQPSVSLSPDDGASFDESPADKALDAGDWELTLHTPALTDRLMVFCNRVAERVVTKYPDQLLGVLAYVQFTRPPVRERVHPNVIPQIAPITYSHTHPMTDDAVPANKELRELVVGWGKAARMTSYYAYAFNLAEVSAPNPMVIRWSKDVPFVLANNCKFWQPETMPNFETSMHALYLGNRLAFDPELHSAVVIRDLNEKFYGSASAPMAQYWSLIDEAWIDTHEYVGCGFGYLKRFPPATMAKARALMNQAISAAKTPQEKFRVGLANDSLALFELFMKMRNDLADGRFATLATDSDVWKKRVIALGEQYKDQFCFTKVPWTDKTINGNYFDAFYKATYDDAARIAKMGQFVGPGVLRRWKYLYEKEVASGADGYAKPDVDDSAWKTIDVAVDSWAGLGHTYDLGSLWYRTEIDVPAAPAGKKTYLWISSTDGSAKVFVNGRHIPYVSVTEQADKSKKTEIKDAPDGYCQPFKFDISGAIKPDAKNQITILGTKTTMINELGTGGLLGPVVVYRDKD